MEPGSVVNSPKIGRWGLSSIEGIHGVFVSSPRSKNELGPRAFSAAVYMCVNTHREVLHTTSAGRGTKKTASLKVKGPRYSCLLTACL